MTDLRQRIAQLSPERLELLIKRSQAEEPPSGPPAIPRREDPSQAPLSSLQRRLWFLDRLEGASPLYNMHAAFVIRGVLDRRALAASLVEMVRRHELLRASFEEVDGEPVQRIGLAPTVSLPLVDLGALPEARRRAESERLARAEARRPFDLPRAPLLRVLLVRLGAAEHLISVTFHHIVADGWSIGVFVGEIAVLYAAFLAGRPSPLAEPPLQYPDYAAWQRLETTEEKLGEQLAYWRQALAGAPALIDLPADRPRPAIRSSRGEAVAVWLPAELTAALRGLAAGESATLYMTLLAGFQALLARLSGQDDVLVGSPEAGRGQVESEGVIGPFVHTLIRRARFTDDPSFRRLLAQVRADVLAAAAHAGLPLDKLVEALQPERSTSYTPLFQVWLVLHTAPMPTLELPGLTLSPLPVHNGTAKFDLTLDLGEADGGIRGFFEHSLDLFDRATVERWAEHLTTLLGRVTEAVDAPLSSLSLLGDGEIRQLLAEWGGADADSPATGASPSVELPGDPGVAAWSGVAVRCGGDELSYRELAQRVYRLARHLRRRGVGPEVAVGLFVERSPDLVVGLLATLEAGGACVPLDPSYPAARLERMVEEAGIGLVLTQQGLLFELPPAAMACDLFCFETDSPDLEAESPEPLGERHPAQSLAYVIFTSGSTGMPKGVGVSRGALAAHLAGFVSALGLNPQDRVLQFASASFDVALEQVLSTMSAGATLVMRGPEGWSGRELDHRIEEDGLTVANLPTGFWQQWQQESDGTAASGLRLVIAGGDAMPAAAVRRWLELPGPEDLMNAYGPTEGVITASLWPVPRRDPGALVSLGRPLPGRGLYVLDRAVSPVPAGVVGELCLAGDLLARGYLGRAGRTAASFVPDPFAGRPGARMYRTGDRVRRRPGGMVEYLGRRDRQVKVRGFRIELGEIEEALRRRPELRDAAAVVDGTGAGEKRIVAYVVPAEGAAPPAADELRSALEESLPQYMLPAVFVPLPELPLTANGKLDRTALPDPDPEREPRARGPVAPRTPVEEAVAGIWSEVLGLSEVSVHDDFFDLGGHSLLGTLVIAEIMEAFEVELPLESLFANSTVASFSARVEAALAEGGEPVRPIEPVPRQGTPPLSFAQQRLWFLEQVAPGTPVYLLPAAVRLAGPLDAGALRRALDQVVARHEVLRTTFAEVDDRPVQVIAPELAVQMPVVDLSGLPPGEREAALRQRATAEARRPFDLARGPLLRLRLLRTSEEEHTLLLTLHHVVADGWSLGILLREVAETYPALVRGERPALPPLPIQYADFALWQRGWLEGQELERQLGYWRRQLEGGPSALDLPFAAPGPAEPSYRGTFRRFEIDPDLVGELRALSQRQGVTLFMTLLAAFQTLLYRFSEQEEFPLGIGIANRNHPPTEQLIGFFVNTLVLRADLSGNPTFLQLLERVRIAALGAFAHQDLPFERLVEELRPGRQLTRSPLFQVMFLFQNTPMPALQVGELELTPMRLDSGTSHFDLTLELAEDGDAIAGVFEYSTERFDDEVIAAMIGHFVNLLQEVVRAPELPVLDLPPRVPALAAGPSAASPLDDQFAFEAGE